MTFYGESHHTGFSEAEVLKLGPVNLTASLNSLQIYEQPQNVTYVKTVHVFRT